MAARTQFKTDIVKRYRNGESSRQIGKDEECSYNTVLRELKRKGVNTGKFWTKEEIEKLRELYPITSSKELLKEFPNRKEGAISGTAARLGLTKRECKKLCRGCGKEFALKTMYGRELCSKCTKKQWEQNNRENAIKRQKRWLQRNPEYLKQYVRRPEVKTRTCRYLKRLRKESPKYRLDCNMGIVVYQALKEKKGGRHWESVVGYTLKDLMKHLENQFDEKMNWENYGNYWH